MEHCRVGIFVRGDIQTLRASAFNLRDVIPDGAPVFLGADFEMEDMGRNLRLTGQPYHESNFFLLLKTLAADVRPVDAVVLACDFRQLDDLFGMIGPATLKLRAQSHRALLHGFRHELLHARHLRRGRLPVVIAHDHTADRTATHVACDIDRNALLLKKGEVFVEIRPGRATAAASTPATAATTSSSATPHGPRSDRAEPRCRPHP